MIRTFSAIAIAALIAGALTVLPGFAPQVEASVPVALAKGDRLDIKQIGTNCSQQAWPNFEPACLRILQQLLDAGPHKARARYAAIAVLPIDGPAFPGGAFAADPKLVLD